MVVIVHILILSSVYWLHTCLNVSAVNGAMHLVMSDKTEMPSPIIRDATYCCWQVCLQWVTSGPDTPDRPPARRHVGERKIIKKKWLHKSVLSGSMKFRGLAFYISVISGELFYHSAVCPLCLQTKANDRMWREPGRSTKPLMTGCFSSHRARHYFKMTRIKA